MKRTTKPSGTQPRHVVKEDGGLVTLWTRSGAHVCTVRRADAIRLGWLAPDKAKRRPR